MSWLTPALVTIILTVVKAIVVLLAVVICGALLSWVERRLLGLWQDRYGPNGSVRSVRSSSARTWSRCSSRRTGPRRSPTR